MTLLGQIDQFRIIFFVFLMLSQASNQTAHTWNSHKPCPWQVMVRCTMSYVVVPIVDLSIQRIRKPKTNRKKLGGRFRPKAKPKPKSKPKKDGVPEPTVVYKKWPVFAPHNMLSALDAGDALDLVTLNLHFKTIPNSLLDSGRPIFLNNMIYPDVWESKERRHGLAELLAVRQNGKMGSDTSPHEFFFF